MFSRRTVALGESEIITNCGIFGHVRPFRRGEIEQRIIDFSRAAINTTEHSGRKKNVDFHRL